MSLKYRFIFTFVLVEILFIGLIVTTNFYTIKNISEKLINEKIESNSTFLVELIKVPISIFDLATLDNLLESSSKYVNSIVILDSQNRILSYKYNFKSLNIEELIKLNNSKEIRGFGTNYRIRHKEIYDEDRYLGKMYMVFDLSYISKIIEVNKDNTFFIIFLEILLSTLFAYVIGKNLTKKLIGLSESAIKIGKERVIDIPYQNDKNEIGILSKAMNSMQYDLIQRNDVIRHSNEMLKTQKEELIRANQVKDDFLANMSHELKTPLNSINVISSIMKRNSQNNLNNKQIENLKIINNCGKELLFLVNDVLDISKLEKSEITLVFEDVILEDFFNDIYKIISPQSKQKNLKFDLNLELTIVKLNIDKHRLKQVINNLLSNAIKFTNSGSISLRVKNTSSQLIITIEDTGVGIPKNKINYVFDRFKQVDTSISRRFGGSGLGLAICKELVSLLKGDILLESEINKGTKISVYLPLERSDNNHIDKINFEKEEQLNQDIKENILILNDEPLFFFRIIVELSKKYEIAQVNNIIDFLKENKDNEFDKAIIYIKEYTEELNQKLSFSNKSNYIVIYEQEIKNSPSFIKSKYEKNEILQNLNNIKDLL